MSKPKSMANSRDGTASVLSETVQSLAEGLTGLASSSKQDLIRSAGSIFQRYRNASFLSSLLEEWNEYRKKGRIADDYVRSEQHRACLGELLNFLDSGIADETRFSVLKQILLVSAEEKMSSRNDVLPLQYMRIARELSPGEVLVLSAAYGAANQGFWKNEGGHDWNEYIAQHSGLHLTDLVEVHVRTLEEKRLLFPPLYADRSGIRVKPYFRLTELGYQFSKFVDAYGDT
jgi:hypothetical protein